MSTDPQPTAGRVVLRDEVSGAWLEFAAPWRIITTSRLDEVLDLIGQIEQHVRAEGLYAAGFIAYEAAPAFDKALSVKADEGFPLLWFGLYEKMQAITLEPEDNLPDTAIAWQPDVTLQAYQDCLHRIRAHIREGQTYQVNYTYRLRAMTGADPWRLFTRIAGDGQAPLAAFVDTGTWAICSASPELFFRQDGSQLVSRPMKGTAARGLWFEDDLRQREHLINSEKDRAENLMIVDMVRNDLGRVAQSGSVQAPALFAAEQYPTLWQMTSTVQAQTQASLADILQAAFPPASITGAPKKRTMEIITDLESSPRRIYTGTIGYLAPGRRAQFNVAIRTVLLHKTDGQAEYGVGGGIVWDSTPESEYAESLTKTKVLSASPREFDLLETLLWSPADGYTLVEHHLLRLSRSAHYFGFRLDLPAIRQALDGLAAGLPAAHHRVRLLVSRQGRITCEATALEPEDLRFDDIPLAAQPVDKDNVFLYHKTTCRDVYAQALRPTPGLSDALLFNTHGQITETTRANIAVEIDGVLCTPPIDCGLLPGTLRAWLLEQNRLRERVITIAEALASPGVYLLNSVRGMHRVHIRGAQAG